MSVLYGTLGFTPAKFLGSVRRRDDLRRVVVFHDRHKRSQTAAQAVATYCQDLDIDFEAVEVDAFDIVESAAMIQNHLRQEEQHAVVMNVTGGTTVLSSAAVLTAILEGTPAVYTHDDTAEEHPLPLLRARYEDFLSPRKRDILRHIHDHDGCTQRDVYEAIKVSKPTANGHIKDLVTYGMIEQRPDPDDARIKRLHAVPAARLLFGGPT